MADPARHHVVRPINRVAARRCARPGCPAPAQSTLSFSYDSRTVRIVPLVDQPGPEIYDLCRDHADRTTPPHGWDLADERPDDPALVDAPEDLGSDRTVAVLAAALHGDAPQEPEARTADRTVEDRAMPEPEPAPGADMDLLGDPADPADTDSDEVASASLALEELAALALEDLEPFAQQPAGRPDGEPSAAADVDDVDRADDTGGAMDAGDRDAPGRAVPAAHRPRD